MMRRPDPLRPAARLARPLLAAGALLATSTLLMAVGAVASAATIPDQMLGTHWYSISLMGNRSGWSEQALRRTPEGFETVEHTVLRISLEGRTLTSARTETRRFDEDARLVSVDHEADQIGRVTRTKAVREGNTLHLTRQGPDGEKTQDLALPDNFDTDLVVLQALLEGQLKPGWTHTFSTLDSDLGRLDEITVTVIERVTDPAPGWLVEARSKLLSVASRTWMDDQGVVRRQEIPGMMGLRMDLATQEEAMAELQPFLLATSIPIAEDFGDPLRLTRVRLQVQDAGGEATTVFASTPRQSVTTEGGNTIYTILAATAPQQVSQLPITGPEFAPFLEPSDMAPCRDERLIAQARAIIGDEGDAWAAARKLMRWVHDKVRKVPSEPRPLSALEVLQEQCGDCTEHTVLMAALCQAVGIPCRMVAGLAYAEKAYHYHAWNEVYVGEWVEMDPTWGEELVDAGHIQIASTALDSASIARMSLASSRTMGTLKLKAVDFETRQ